MAGATAAAGLFAASALHVVWARGSTWPAADPADLAELVVGRRPPDDAPGPVTPAVDPSNDAMPGSTETLAVAGLLAAASLLTAAAAGLIPLRGHRAHCLARLGTGAASGVLLARGSGGLVVSSLGLLPTSERFRRWDVRLYSPLCLGLGGAAALAARGG